MSTIDDIEDSGQLERLKVKLEFGEFDERKIYVSPDVKSWLEQTLPGLETSIAEGRLSPLEQMQDRLYNFIIGGILICEDGRDLHEMWPHNHDIWELKTVDVRMFGWFYTPKIFICVYIDSKERMEKSKALGIDLYAIYRNNTLKFRNLLDLDSPKFGPAEDVKNELCF